MKYESEMVDAVAAELDRVHIRWRKEKTDGNHVRITWRATPDKEEREMIVGANQSDWRARMNARAHVRRVLRHDGVSLMPVPSKRSQSAFMKALNLPQPVEPIPDQIAALRSEVADLTALAQSIEDYVAFIKAALTAKPMLPSPPIVPSVRSVDLLEHMTQNPTLVEMLANRTGLERKQVYAKLMYLKKQGKVALTGGMWRRV